MRQGLVTLTLLLSACSIRLTGSTYFPPERFETAFAELENTNPAIRQKAFDDLCDADPEIIKPVLLCLLDANAGRIEDNNRLLVASKREVGAADLLIRMAAHYRDEAAMSAVARLVATEKDELIEPILLWLRRVPKTGEVTARLAEMLRDGKFSPITRLETYRTLVALGEKNALDQAARDPDPKIRMFAMKSFRSLAENGLPRIQDMAADRNRQVSLYAIEMLEEIGDRSSVYVLIPLVRSTDAEIALRANSALARLTGNVIAITKSTPGRERAHDLWQDWLDKNAAALPPRPRGDPLQKGILTVAAERRAAVCLDAIFAGDAVAANLAIEELKSLGDVSIGVLAPAYAPEPDGTAPCRRMETALGHLDPVFAALAYSSDANEQEAVSTIKNLERRPLSPNGALITEKLARLIGKETRLNVLRELVRCLDRYPEQVPVAKMLGNWQDRNSLVKNEIAAQAEKRIHPADTLALEMLARDKNNAIRLRAARAAGEMQPERVRAFLEVLVRDPDEKVRQHALVSLAAHGNPLGLVKLPELLETLDGTILLRAIEAAARSQNADSVWPLLKILERANDQFALPASNALRKITGHYVQFDPDAPVERKRQAIDAWKNYVHENAGKFIKN